MASQAQWTKEIVYCHGCDQLTGIENVAQQERPGRLYLVDQHYPAISECTVGCCCKKAAELRAYYKTVQEKEKP